MKDFKKLAAAYSCNRDVPTCKPMPKQNCSDISNISVFFDGTGNNKDVDATDEKWSNPARIWRAAQLLREKDTTSYSIYISGIGTPFNGGATGWIDESLMRAEDGDVIGLGAGGGATRRLSFGEVSVNDRLRMNLMKSAAKLDISLKPYSEKGAPGHMQELAAAIEAHGLITIINLSIFGFSRGAALARVFSNNILKECVPDSNKILRYHGVPLRINFMGLFDTVASFGLPSKNIDAPFAETNLVVSHAVERCVHFVAAHELRFSFPVDLIQLNGLLKLGWKESVYPGVHSDVGGGYEPIEQNICNNYSRIPMRDMMEEALIGGVRLVAYADVKKLDAELFKAQFEIRPEVEVAYKKYMNSVGAHSTVEQAVTAHMKALYSAWGTMTRQHLKTPDLIQRHSEQGGWKYVARAGIAAEADFFMAEDHFEKNARSAVPVNIPFRNMNVEGKLYGITVRPARWRLDAWRTTSPEPVLYFVQRYIHDSKAGFLHATEPFSYFTARGMSESSRNVLARGLDWMDDTVTAVKNGVIKVYHRAEGVVVETYEDGILVATQTYKVGEKFVVDTARAGVKYTVEVYQSGEQVVITAVNKGEQMVVTSIDAAKRTIGVVGNEVYTSATKFTKSVGDAADTGLHAVEGGWHSLRSAAGLK